MSASFSSGRRRKRCVRLLTDPIEYVRWKGQLADFDARAGGRYRVSFPNRKDVVAGTYVEVIPNRRVVFTWGWEGNEHLPPGASTVEIDLAPEGTGTRLRLVHRGLPEDSITAHVEGWDFFLPRLTDVAEGREPRQAPHHTEPSQ